MAFIVVGDSADTEAANREWLASLFAQFSLPLTRFAIRRMDEAAAADVISETFLIAWNQVADIPRDRPDLWLYGVARNVIRREIRSRRQFTSLHDRAAQEAATVTSAIDDHAEQVAARLLVRQTFDQLSDDDQEVLRLTEWDHLAVEDAAVVLDCSVITVKMRLHRARRRFDSKLAEAQRAELRADNEDFAPGLLALRRSLDDQGVTQ